MKILKVLFIITLVFSLAGCIQDYIIAPDGTTMNISAFPSTIYYTDDYSTITVTAFEPSGRPVRDDVYVYFYTTMGIIDSEAKTKNGKVEVKLYSNGEIGTAAVTASMSGAEDVSINIEITDEL